MKRLQPFALFSIPTLLASIIVVPNASPILASHDDGQFWGVYGIDGNSGFVYIIDSGNNRIQKFDSNGNFITKWGALGRGNGQFIGPEDLTVDSSGYVYVTELNNNRIQKFDSNGNFITKWGTNGTDNGHFRSPTGIAVDSSDNVYVADNLNNRIQKFDSNGNFITKWGSECIYPSLPCQFLYPHDVAIDSSNNVYVTESSNILLKSNNRIQKFDSNGNFITKWGTNGTDNGHFRSPTGIAVDSSDNVYVADNLNNRIQKFDSNGNFITKWGSECLMRHNLVQHKTCIDSDGVGHQTIGDGQFLNPYDVATDSSDYVYVADNLNNRIQKFDSNGNFITKWGANSSRIYGSTAGAVLADPPAPQPRESDHDWHFIAAGDWGSNIETIKTVENINEFMNENRNVEFIVGLGDYSYFGTGEKTPTEKWWDIIMKPLQSKFIATLGNHETNEIPLYKKLFGLNNSYFSFNHKSIHFISINIMEPLDAGSPQLTFVKSDLDNAQKDPNVKWIIPFLHHQLYSSKSIIAGDGNRLGSGYHERFLLHSLFDRYSKIDLVLQAHSHNYQRTFPILYNNHMIPQYPYAYLEDPIITEYSTHSYSGIDGQIYLTVGTAGAPLHLIEEYPPYVSVQQVRHGFLDIQVKDNGNTLVGRFCPNDSKVGEQNYDDYFIIRN